MPSSPKQIGSPMLLSVASQDSQHASSTTKTSPTDKNKYTLWEDDGDQMHMSGGSGTLQMSGSNALQQKGIDLHLTSCIKGT